MKKEEFKEFVRKNPNLLEYVNNNQMSWQKFFELYDIYGEDNRVWDKYKISEKEIKDPVNKTSSINDLISMVKNLDLETVRKSVEGVSKAVSIIQELTSKKEEEKDIYEPRPIYKRFED